MDRIIRRRIEFLLNEARSENPKRDSAITYAMRALSNYLEVGKDAPSAELKRRLSRISRRALELERTLPFQQWHQSTTNDHPDPLAEVWDWMVRERMALDHDAVLTRFRAHPMVIILKDEDPDRKLNRGDRAVGRGTPAERYRHIGEIMERPRVPYIDATSGRRAPGRRSDERRSKRT